LADGPLGFTLEDRDVYVGNLYVELNFNGTGNGVFVSVTRDGKNVDALLALGERFFAKSRL
jgi:hypothetical protein